MAQEYCPQDPRLGGPALTRIPAFSSQAWSALPPPSGACTNRRLQAGCSPPCVTCVPLSRVCVARPFLFAHLPQRSVLETSPAQPVERLGQGEGSEAVEGRPSAHVLFVALGDSSAQSEQKDKHWTERRSAEGAV